MQRDPDGEHTTPDAVAESNPTPDSTPGSGRDERTGSPVVGIGASANGLAALRSFAAALPADPGMTFVVIQHLAPDHASNLSGLLQKSTDLPVESADEGIRLEPNHIYVISPGDQLSLDDGVLRTERLPDLETKRDTIDFFFRTLAEDCEERAVGILLSGAGTDGTTGLRLIKQHGGLTMAQDPDEAGVDMMPRSAIDAGFVDIVSPVAQLPDRLTDVATPERQFGPPSTPEDLGDRQTETLNDIMARLRERTGNDLSDYTRPTVLRRIGRRMQVLQLDSLEAYRDHLDSHPGEVDALFDELLIKVTRFFRDPETWKYLEHEIVPQLFEGKGRDDQVRVWIPGCATGEEAYTLAILLRRHAETLDRPPEIKVFATDIDRGSIRTARDGLYPSAIASDVPTEYLQRYFRVEDDRYRVAKEVRNQVLFAAQNALTDPPFSSLDLVSCRNLLIYLEASAQQRLLQLLHYALREKGCLLLGGSETPSQETDLFETVDRTHHLYRALPGRGRDREVVVPGSAFDYEPVLPEAIDVDAGSEPDDGIELGAIHRDAVLESHELASVLIDEHETLLHTAGDVRPYLSIPAGKTTDNVLDLIDEALRPTVRTVLFEAFRNDGESVRRQTAGDENHSAVDIQATPIDDDRADGLLVELSFQPIPDDAQPIAAEDVEDVETEPIIRRYEREIERLQSRLEITVEEYQAANQKLRVSNEELMSMNEEMQSTTEELETSKEELQSMNEELQTVNDELNEKIRELDELNDDLRNLMRSTDIGTIFLDRDLAIKRYTDPVTDFFNLLPADRGRPLEHVTHSLDTDQLPELARRVLEEEETTIERDIAGDDRRHLLVRVLPYLTVDDEVDGVVLTFVDIAARKRYEKALVESKERAEQLAELRSMFLSTLSHDVRSPLAAIMTMTGVMRRTLDDDQIEMIDRIERAAQQLHKILDSILRMAKLETHESAAIAESFEIVTKIEDVLDLHEPLADGAGLALEFEGPEPPVDVELDPRFLTQILNNLVDNAIKYTDEGGVTIRLTTGEGRIAIDVADTGTGIPEEERELIFERFETSSEHDPSNYDSIGLGLAITRLLVESMDGAVSVESTPGEGSTFTVELPRRIGGNAARDASR